MSVISFSHESFIKLHQESNALKKQSFNLIESQLALIKRSYQNNKAYRTLRSIDPHLVDDSKKDSSCHVIETLKKVYFGLRKKFFQLFYDIDALSQICNSYKKDFQDLIESYADFQFKSFEFNEKVKGCSLLPPYSKDVLFVKALNMNNFLAAQDSLICVTKKVPNIANTLTVDPSAKKQSATFLYELIKQCSQNEVFARFFINGFLPAIIALDPTQTSSGYVIKIEFNKATERTVKTSDLHFLLHFQKQFSFAYKAETQSFEFPGKAIKITLPILGSYELASVRFSQGQIVLKARKFGISSKEVSLSLLQFISLFS